MTNVTSDTWRPSVRSSPSSPSRQPNGAVGPEIVSSNAGMTTEGP